MSSDTVEQVDKTMTKRPFISDAWVPDPLPEGKTEVDLRAYCVADLVRRAQDAGYALDPGSVHVVSDEPYANPNTGDPGRRVVFAGDGFQVKAEETIVQAVEDADEPGTWVAEVSGSGGLYSVKHGLDTQDVLVRCYRETGERIGCAEAIAITEGDVTVFAMPGTALIRVTEAPEEPEGDEDAEPGA